MKNLCLSSIQNFNDLPQEAEAHQAIYATKLHVAQTLGCNCIDGKSTHYIFICAPCGSSSMGCVNWRSIELALKYYEELEKLIVTDQEEKNRQRLADIARQRKWIGNRSEWAYQAQKMLDTVEKSIRKAMSDQSYTDPLQSP